MSDASGKDRYDELWKRIDEDRRLDRRIRRISYVAWGATIVAVVAYEVPLAWRVLTSGTIWFYWRTGQLTPLIIVVGALSLLVAVLATIGMFIRFRTATLHEIHLRLSAMEEMLTRDSE